MTEPESIMLQIHRRIDTLLGRTERPMGVLTQRVNSLKYQGVELCHDLVCTDTCLDHIERRIDRIERRLNLMDA